jgi:hypothetical protein
MRELNYIALHFALAMKWEGYQFINLHLPANNNILLEAARRYAKNNGISPWVAEIAFRAGYLNLLRPEIEIDVQKWLKD